MSDGFEYGDGEDGVALVTYEVIETEDSFGLGMQSRVDEDAATEAGKAFLHDVGEDLPDLLGCIIVVSGEDVDDRGHGFITAKTLLPVDVEVDEELLNRATQKLMATLIKILLPEAEIASIDRTSRGYLN